MDEQHSNVKFVWQWKNNQGEWANLQCDGPTEDAARNYGPRSLQLLEANPLLRLPRPAAVDGEPTVRLIRHTTIIEDITDQADNTDAGVRIGGASTPTAPPPGPATAMDIAAEMAHLIVQFSDWLDSTYGPEVSAGEALFRRTTNKLGEELGELAEALGGWIGENPRKGVTNSHDRVLSELMDIAGAALGASVHVSRRAGVEAEPVRMLHDKLRYITERAGLTPADASQADSPSDDGPAEPDGDPDNEPWYEFYTTAGDRFAHTLIQLALANGPLTPGQVEAELAEIQAQCAAAGHPEASDTACRESIAAALEQHPDRAEPPAS